MKRPRTMLGLALSNCWYIDRRLEKTAAVFPFVPLNDSGVNLSDFDAKAIGRVVSDVEPFEVDCEVAGAKVFNRAGMPDKHLAER